MNPALLFIIVFIQAVLSVGLVISLHLYIDTLRKLGKLQDEHDKSAHTIHERALKHLEHTKEKAYTVLEQAESRAAEIIRNAQTFTATQDKELQKSIETLTDSQKKALIEKTHEMMKQYEDTIARLTQDNIILLKSTSKSIESSLSGQVAGFTSVLETETIAAEKQAQQQVSEAYEKVKNEIEAYKSERLQHIDDLVYTSVQEITEAVLGKALNMKDHEKLIIEALAEAKSKKDHLL